MDHRREQLLNNARKHPAFADALNNAGDRALRDKARYHVYYDGRAVYLRAAEAVPPVGATLMVEVSPSPLSGRIEFRYPSSGIVTTINRGGAS